MITLQQVQQLRNRVDTLRLSLIELREENAQLKHEADERSEYISEMEEQLKYYQEAEQNIDTEMNNLLEDLDKDFVGEQRADDLRQPEDQLPQHYVTTE